MSCLKLPRWLVVFFCLAIHIAHSQSTIQKIMVYPKGSMLLVDINTEIVFPKAVSEAIHSGVTLVFSYEFEIKEEKWYKLQPFVEVSKQFYLSYDRMTNRYSVTDPVTYVNEDFGSLYEAKLFMQNLSAFPLILRTKMPNNAAILGVRFHLTNANLPSYIGVERMFNDDWDIDSQWYYQKL